MGSSSSKSKDPPKLAAQTRLPKKNGGSGKAAWTKANGVTNVSHQRFTNKIKYSDEDTLGRTTYNLFDIQDEAVRRRKDSINVDYSEKLHSFEKAAHVEKFANFQNLTEERDRRMKEELDLNNGKSSSAPIQTYRRRRSSSPNKSPKKSPKKSPQKSPKKSVHSRSPKKVSTLADRPPWDNGSPIRRHSDVSTIDMTSPQHFRTLPPVIKTNGKTRFNHASVYDKQQRNGRSPPPIRRARSSSPLRKRSPPNKVAPAKGRRSGPPVTRRRPGGSGARFTGIGGMKSASHSMDSALSNISNFEVRSKVETFSDKKESLSSAGLGKIVSLGNSIPDHKITGQSYDQAKKDMDSDDWSKEIKGIEVIVSLARDRPDILRSDMKIVVKYLMAELKNLRSQVCRVAGDAFAELFFHLGKAMEVDLDKSAPLLLQKAADTNKFIQESCSAALDSMIENVTVLRGVQVIIEGGLNHKANAVRTNVARLLDKVVTQLGSERFMGSSRELQELIMQSGSKLLLDANPEVRKHSKHLFAQLMRHQKFDSLQMATLKESERNNIKKVLSSLK